MKMYNGNFKSLSLNFKLTPQELVFIRKCGIHLISASKEGGTH